MVRPKQVLLGELLLGNIQNHGQARWPARTSIAELSSAKLHHPSRWRYTEAMNASDFYLLAADLMLITHALFVVFVVVGLILILIGGACSWPWVRNPWFRLSHFIAIGFVVIQSWLGAICPLTVWENALREKAGEVGYQSTFISHWLEKLLYYQFPQWVFIVVYTIFGALVLVSWFWVRPRAFR